MNTIAKLRELGRVAHIGGARERPVECMAIVDALPALLAVAEAAKEDITKHATPMVVNHVKRLFINGHDVTETVNALTQLDEVEL